MTQPLRVFIGYDSREPIALEVCAFSISQRTSGPVAFIPLALNHLKGIYTREPNGTTEFSLSRFLVPYLSGYEGVSIFMDCDMLAQCNIYDAMDTILADLEQIDANPDLLPPAVWCCQHDYAPKDVPKVTGEQTSYPRKNWSSFMVFNNLSCKALTPEYVNTASPADLHRMVWADERIGSLPLEYNWLVGEYPHNSRAKILHYTLGTPCFSDYRDCDHAGEWWREYAKMSAPIDAWIAHEPYAVARIAGYPVPPRTL
jgi:hypothetical protein